MFPRPIRQRTKSSTSNDKNSIRGPVQVGGSRLATRLRAPFNRWAARYGAMTVHSLASPSAATRGDRTGRHALSRRQGPLTKLEQNQAKLSTNLQASHRSAARFGGLTSLWGQGACVVLHLRR